MRIAVGGYSHETNSFSNILVPKEAVQRSISHGDRFLSGSIGVRNYIGGMIDEAAALGIELVPAIQGGAHPSGPTTQEAFELFLQALVAKLWDAQCSQPLDAIALSLHGAGVALGYDDLEGTILQAIRDKFGSDIPIGIVLDLHGNITPEMVALSDVVVGCKCYPHVDQYESARAMLNLLHETVAKGKRLGKSLMQLPWLMPPGFGVTLSGPAHDVQQFMAKQTAECPALLDASFFHGFAYADVAFAGTSVVTMARDQETADRAAHEIAAYAWSHRKDFHAPIHSAAAAMDLAEKAEGPVVINESSDNPGGGTPGDGTHLLREMLRRNLPGSAFGFIYDPEVVLQAIRAGVGNRICCSLGAKNDDLHGAPILLEDAYIKTISDGTFIQKNPMGAGAKSRLGKTVLLVVGNVQIVVASVRTQTFDDAPFEITGIDWRSQRILALKSTHHFKGWWADKVSTIIPCDSPGIHSSDLSAFRFTKLTKKVFPFHDVSWE